MVSYIKDKRYYDRKADKTPLKVNDYCYVLNPKADNQSMTFAFFECIWTGPFIVVKTLSNNNYTIRRLGTRYTQTLHRIRLRIYKAAQRLPDVTVKPTDYLPDPEVIIHHNEWYAQAWEPHLQEPDTSAPIENQQNSNHNLAPNTSYEVRDINDDETATEPDFTNINMDIGDNPFITNPPPFESPPASPTYSPTHVGYNPRKVANHNLRPNPTPNLKQHFRRLDAITITQEIN